MHCNKKTKETIFLFLKEKKNFKKPKKWARKGNEKSKNRYFRLESPPMNLTTIHMHNHRLYLPSSKFNHLWVHMLQLLFSLYSVVCDI